MSEWENPMNLKIGDNFRKVLGLKEQSVVANRD